MYEMSPRERAIATLSFKKPDRIPRDAGFTPHVMEEFRRHTGADDPAEHYGFVHRNVAPAPTKVEYSFSRYYPQYPDGLPAGTSVSEWGEANVPGDFYHFTTYLAPLASVNTLEELKAFPWPDVKADYRYADLANSVKSLREAGYFVIGSLGHTGWEKACYMRGIDNISCDLIDNREYAEYLLDLFCDAHSFMARRYAEAGVDMVWLSEDMGMQDRLFMSPEMYRKWVKPRTKKVIDAAREVSPDVFIAQHHCGKVDALIPDFIEIGTNALNPIQPECMDPLDIKRRFGDVLTLWGTVGAQSVFPFGTADQVRQTVRDNIRNLGYNGGFWIAPSQILEPEVPWENIAAFFEAVEEYGG